SSDVCSSDLLEGAGVIFQVQDQPEFEGGGRECDVDVGALGLLEHPGDEPLVQFRVKDTPDLVVLVAGAAFRLPHEGHMVTARRNDGELAPLSVPYPAAILLLGRSLA